jgi:hypothetical protein
VSTDGYSQEVKPNPVTATDIATIGLVPQNLTMFSVNLNGSATNPAYRSCQPFGLAPTKSQRVCPEAFLARRLHKAIETVWVYMSILSLVEAPRRLLLNLYVS